MTCWVKLQSKMNLQKICDDSEEPIKDDQFISGKLKSPTKMQLLNDKISGI